MRPACVKVKWPDAYVDIQTGKFARDFVLENQAGQPLLKARRRLGAEHPIEEVGARQAW